MLPKMEYSGEIMEMAKKPTPTPIIIIKTGSIDIQVAGIDTSIARATDEIHALGGWLAGSDRTTSDAQDMASATYRVPAARFEDALAAMRAPRDFDTPAEKPAIPDGKPAAPGEPAPRMSRAR